MKQLAVKYIDFKIIDSDRRPISIVCFDINKNGDKYTRLVVAVDSEEFDKYLDTAALIKITQNPLKNGHFHYGFLGPEWVF